MKKFDSYNDNYQPDFDDSQQHEEELYVGHVYISSVLDKEVIELLVQFIPDTLEIFKKRYLLSELDYDTFMYNVRRINLYNYVYDEFNHVLHSKKYKKVLESEISNEDLDNIYAALLDIIMTILDDNSEIDLDDEEDEND